MLSVTSWCLIGIPIQQWPRYLKMIHNSGFEGIELHVDLKPWPIPPDVKSDELSWLLGVIHDAGLKVTSFSTMIHINDPITAKNISSRKLALQAAYKMLELVKLMGGKHISIAPGGTEANWESVVPIIKDLNNKAKSIGIPLMLENVWYSFSRNLTELEKIVDAIGDPNLGVCFDIGNALPYGNVEEWLLRFKGKIGKIHITDSIGVNPPEICSIGQGKVDWINVGKIVKDMNYTGDLTLELFPKQGLSLPLELIRTSRFITKHFELGGI